jgi:hypothetical protein
VGSLRELKQHDARETRTQIRSLSYLLDALSVLFSPMSHASETDECHCQMERKLSAATSADPWVVFYVFYVSNPRMRCHILGLIARYERIQPEPRTSHTQTQKKK